MKTKTQFSDYTLAALLILCCTATVPAATNVVRIGSFWFSPTNSTINVGDTIVWSNTVPTSHDSTGTGGLWSSGSLVQNATFKRTFTSTGAFFYFCSPHISSQPGQTGNVFVVSAPVSPSVSLTNPANNARFSAPASFTLMAAATDDGAVTNVQFLRDSTLISSLNTPPYQFAVTSLAAGNYTFLARAVDNLGLAATSAPVAIQVLTNALLSNLILTPGAAQFTVSGIAGQTYIAEVSTNAADWFPFTTNVAPAAMFGITNSPATDLMRLYRVKQTLQ